MAAVLERQAKRWTYEEYYKLDDDQRCEIIDGNLLMAAAPDTWHQSWIDDPANKALEILKLQQGHYELHCCAEEKGKLTSLVLAGSEFDLTEIQ